MTSVNLKAERLNRGLNLAEAAEEIGVLRESLRLAELGRVVPTPSNAKRIADFYGYRVTDIWPVDDPSPAAA